MILNPIYLRRKGLSLVRGPSDESFDLYKESTKWHVPNSDTYLETSSSIDSGLKLQKKNGDREKKVGM